MVTKKQRKKDHEKRLKRMSKRLNLSKKKVLRLAVLKLEGNCQ